MSIAVVHWICCQLHQCLAHCLFNIRTMFSHLQAFANSHWYTRQTGVDRHFKRYSRLLSCQRLTLTTRILYEKVRSSSMLMETTGPPRWDVQEQCLRGFRANAETKKTDFQTDILWHDWVESSPNDPGTTEHEKGFPRCECFVLVGMINRRREVHRSINRRLLSRQIGGQNVVNNFLSARWRFKHRCFPASSIHVRTF